MHSKARPSRLSYCALIVAAALLAACGGSQPPIGAPGAMPQGVATIMHAQKSTSGTLLYASAIAGSRVAVLSYPKGKLVQTLTGFAYPPYFICSDASGNVFVPTTNLTSPGYIYEFAHGGTQPTQTLTDPGPGYALSCSVDPKTGNLAVANGPDVAIYAQGQGTATIYNASDVGAIDCAYDDSGDLFVDGRLYDDKIAELPFGGSSFSDIALNEQITTGHLQWWNNRLVFLSGTHTRHGPFEIFQVRISGSNGTVSGPVLLSDKHRSRGTTLVEFALSAKTIIVPEGRYGSLLGLWHYPSGGNTYKALRPPYAGYYGVAISVAPSH